MRQDTLIKWVGKRANIGALVKSSCLAHRLLFSLLFISLLFSPYALTSQSSKQSSKQKKEDLENQMKTLRKEISDMQKQLEQTTSKKKEDLEQVEILKEKIEKREALITNYSNQIGNLEEDINGTEKDIESQTEQVEKMKKDYAQMLRTTYSNLALQNEVVFLISSSSFNEAVSRYHYLRRISDYRRKQTEELDQYIHDLENKKTDLELNKKKKEGLLQAQSQQKEKLQSEKEETDKVIAQLGDKEKKMRRYVELKNKAAQALNSRIQKIIEDEIKSARKKAEDAALAAKKKAQAEARAKNNGTTVTTINKNPARTETILMSPKDQALTSDFASNKGKLPWPVAKGTIVGAFGKHEHATLKGVFIENNGLDIQAAEGVNGRAIFAGSVVSIFTLPTTQTCIIIKHGEYFTVYSNIAEAKVKTNDNVITKQILGTLYTDKNDAQPKIHLEIWKGKDKLNPAEWISPN